MFENTTIKKKFRIKKTEYDKNRSFSNSDEKKIISLQKYKLLKRRKFLNKKKKLNTIYRDKHTPLRTSVFSAHQWKQPPYNQSLTTTNCFSIIKSRT